MQLNTFLLAPALFLLLAPSTIQASNIPAPIPLTPHLAHRAVTGEKTPPYFTVVAYQMSIGCNGESQVALSNLGYGDCVAAEPNHVWGSIEFYETGPVDPNTGELPECYAVSYTDNDCTQSARQSEKFNTDIGTCAQTADNELEIENTGARSFKIHCN